MPRIPDSAHAIVHASDSPMVPLLESLDRIAASEANVLVVGESGSGKENVVRAIHARSARCKGPFVPVNCGAIPETLLGSVLFGHERGAFTGADRRHAGRLEAAAGGMLFLDEIGDMPLSLQVKLLRVIQERTFQPLGASQPREADFRLVAATHQPLKEAVEDGRFREDLFYRLDVVRIDVPPLRERTMDIPLLAAHFLQRYRETSASHVEQFTAQGLACLSRYPWPGNVRQLENMVQSALVLREEGEIEVTDVEDRLGPPPDGSLMTGVSVDLPPSGLDLRDTLERLERRLIRQALERTCGNRARAADLLRLNRTTLVEKLKRNPVVD
jgi:DNA-binding NtrC family response regulator